MSLALMILAGICVPFGLFVAAEFDPRDDAFLDEGRPHLKIREAME